MREIKREIEAEYETVLGEERMRLLYLALRKLLEQEDGKDR